MKMHLLAMQADRAAQGLARLTSAGSARAFSWARENDLESVGARAHIGPTNSILPRAVRTVSRYRVLSRSEALESYDLRSTQLLSIEDAPQVSHHHDQPCATG